jgi:hypothetical protein
MASSADNLGDIVLIGGLAVSVFIVIRYANSIAKDSKLSGKTGSDWLSGKFSWLFAAGAIGIGGGALLRILMI